MRSSNVQDYLYKQNKSKNAALKNNFNVKIKNQQLCGLFMCVYIFQWLIEKKQRLIQEDGQDDITPNLK
jgi:hypothetical protein